jgi:hypothetical protein
MDRPADDDEGVLYVRSMCMVCRDKTYNCPYCDGEGKTYIEAADKTVARWINNLSTERKDDIIKYIQKGLKDGKASE